MGWKKDLFASQVVYILALEEVGVTQKEIAKQLDISTAKVSKKDFELASLNEEDCARKSTTVDDRVLRRLNA